ncbi:hypothetical protein [Sphingomonas sp. HMP6]|uniref:hypothetical protein n=1 Tax=Sphingomonas sp. HMP6 TaxID=1517551 RepID=UPI0015964FD9|nr:hypothetical protein [Sphingomonas sp. HMP6]BCA57722.1 hypothetical protein HMP06_0491 [Sphingomonas sp. HMP6]
MSDHDGNISGRGLRFLETEVGARLANEKWLAAINDLIAYHRTRADQHEAEITRLLAGMAERQRADAEFEAAWNAMTYREAVAFQQGRAS